MKKNMPYNIIFILDIYYVKLSVLAFTNYCCSLSSLIHFIIINVLKPKFTIWTFFERFLKLSLSKPYQILLNIPLT